MSTSIFNANTQLEHLQAKHIGTGHADTTKHEWLTNIHRDTYASFIGHTSQQTYFSVAKNCSNARLRYEYMEVSLFFFIVYL